MGTFLGVSVSSYFEKLPTIFFSAKQQWSISLLNEMPQSTNLPPTKILVILTSSDGQLGFFSKAP